MYTQVPLEATQTLKKLGSVFAFPATAVLLLWVGIIPVQYNPIILGIVFCMIGLGVRRAVITNTWSLVEIGFHWKNITKGLPYYSMLIFIGALCFAYAHKFVPVRESIVSSQGVSWKFLVSVLICTGMQQFLFSAYLIKKMKDIFSPHRWGIVCGIVVIFFTGAHIFFSNPEVVLPATFVFSAVVTPLYYFQPNYLFAWMTHSIFNAFVIYVKVFTPIWA